MSYYVKYKIFNREREQGPFDTRSDASWHRWDIQGYEGVTEARVEERADVRKDD